MHPVFNPVAPYRYLLPNLYLSVADIVNPDFFACSSRTWISLNIARFYEEHCHPSRGSACPQNRATIAGGGRGRHNLYRVFQHAVTAPSRVCCVVWSPSCLFLFVSHLPRLSFSCISLLGPTSILVRDCLTPGSNIHGVCPQIQDS